MSTYSIPFIRTNINSTTATSLPYVTNPFRIRIPITTSTTIPITSSDTIYASFELWYAYNMPDPDTGIPIHTYYISYSDFVTFSNFNPPNTSFSEKPRILNLNTTNSLPSYMNIQYSDLTNTGFMYTIGGEYSTTEDVIPFMNLTIDVSFSYFAST